MANRFLSNIKINDAYTFPASDGTNGQVIKTDGSGNLSFAQLAADSASVMYKDTFTGNGSATAFTLANALNDEVQSNVYIDGVYQSKSTYSVSGTTLTFSTAPASGHEIEVISTTGINSGPTAIYTDNFTGNGSATAFTLGQTVHDENQTLVFLNGVYQFKNTYTLSGTTLTLDAAPANGVAIEVMSIGSAYSGGDILYDHDFGSAGLMTTNGSGVYSITANNSANWNTAYGWGDHSTQSYATQSYVGTQIANLVDSSPSTLDTLNELAAALGDDPNFATTTANSIGTKMPLAGGTFTGNVGLLDNIILRIGTGNDLELYHNNSSVFSQIRNNTGDLYITNLANDKDIIFQGNDGGSVGTVLTLDMSASGNATFGGDILFNGSGVISSNTTDGSDNAQLIIVGGGTDGDSRGASVHLSGNEHGNGGLLQLRAGSGSISQIRSYTNGSERMRIDSSGQITNTMSGGKVLTDINGFITSFQTLDTATAGGRFIGKSNRGVLGSIHIEQTTTGADGGYIGFETSPNGSTTPTERMRIDSSGNVGIGPQSTGTLNYKLQISSGVDGDGIVLTGIGDNTGIADGSYKKIGFRYDDTDESYESEIRFVVPTRGIHGGQMEFFTDNTSGTKTRAMTINNAQNVGIGTTGPSYKLHIVGNVFTSAYNGYLASYNNTASYHGSLKWSALQLGNNGSNRIIGGRTATGGALDFYTNNTNDASNNNVTPDGTFVMRMAANGNVAIGATSSSSKLKVDGPNTSSNPLVDLVASGTGTFQRGVRLLNGGMNVGDHIMYSVGRSDNTRNMGQTYFYYAGNGSTSNRISMGLHGVDDVFNIAGTGNVGIGTTAPNEKLQVDGHIRVAGVGNAILFDTTGANSSNGIKTIDNYETVIFNQRGSAGFAVIGNSNIRIGFGTSYTTGQTKLAIETDGTIRAKTGSIVVDTAGQGIYLGGTAVANKLDDYEEGTFTSGVVSSNLTNYSYSGPNGRYTKIGRQVIVTFKISNITATTGQKYIVVNNLPFAQHTASHDEQGFCSNYPDGQRRSGIVINNSSGNNDQWYVSYYNNTAQSGTDAIRVTIIYTTT